MYESYKTFRPMAIFGGIIGLASLWIAMSITGIVAYYCQLDFSGIRASMNTITELTFFQMYFKGPCQLPLPLDFQVLNNLDLMNPDEVHPWMWVYLVFSFIWGISSFSLLTNATHNHIKYVNIILSIWVILTVTLSSIDLALGIIFGLDYRALELRAQELPLGAETYPHYAIISAQISSITMMIVALRGFILWITNILLSAYFFMEMFKISAYNKFGGPPISYLNKPSDDREPPIIDAYGKRPTMPESNLWINQPQYQPKTSTQLNSRSLYDDRRRHYDAQSITAPISASNRQVKPWESEELETPIRTSSRQLKPWENDGRDNATPIHTSSRQLKPWENDGRGNGSPIHASSHQLKPWENDGRQNAASIARELSQRQSSLNTTAKPEPILPDPDYSPTIPRINRTFDSRSQSRNPMKSSRF